MRFREGISVGTQPDGRALPVSPRYQSERSTKLNGTAKVPESSGAFVVSAVCWNVDGIWAQVLISRASRRSSPAMSRDLPHFASRGSRTVALRYRQSPS